MKKIKTGNIEELLPEEKKGWAIGYNVAEPFKTDLFGLKWAVYKKGEKKDQLVAPEGKTVTFLISGKFKNTFFDDKGNIIQECVMENQGDYIYYDKNIMHTWEALEDSIIFALRWPAK